MTARRPDNLKVLAGTARPDRAVSTPALPALGDVQPPAWMKNLDAVREWNRLAPVLTANRLLHEGNIGLLAQLCAVHGRLVRMWTEGSPNAALITAYRRLASDLGISSMVVTAPAVKPNRFSNNAKLLRDGAR